MYDLTFQMKKERREKKSRKRRNNTRTYVLRVMCWFAFWFLFNTHMDRGQQIIPRVKAKRGRRNTPENKDPLMFHCFIQTI